MVAGYENLIADIYASKCRPPRTQDATIHDAEPTVEVVAAAAE